MCLLLFSFTISKRMFLQILGLLLYFNMNVEVFTIFYFPKKVNFLPQKLAFLVVGFFKKMNTACDSRFDPKVTGSLVMR